MPNYYEKYLKYKNKYTKLKANKIQIGGLFDITRDLCVYNDTNNNTCIRPRYMNNLFTQTETFFDIINNFFSDITRYVSGYDNRYDQPGNNINKLSHLILTIVFRAHYEMIFKNYMYDPEIDYKTIMGAIIKDYITPIYKYTHAEYSKIDNIYKTHPQYNQMTQFIKRLPDYKNTTNWLGENATDLNYTQNPNNNQALTMLFPHLFPNLDKQIKNIISYEQLIINNIIGLVDNGIYHILFIILIFIGIHKYKNINIIDGLNFMGSIVQGRAPTPKDVYDFFLINEIGNAPHYTLEYDVYIHKQYSVDIVLSPFLIEGNMNPEYPQIFIKSRIDMANNINKIILILSIPCVDLLNVPLKTCRVTQIESYTQQTGMVTATKIKNELDDVVAIIFYEFIQKIFSGVNLCLVTRDKYRWLPVDINIIFQNPAKYINKLGVITFDDKILLPSENKINFSSEATSTRQVPGSEVISTHPNPLDNQQPDKSLTETQQDFYIPDTQYEPQIKKRQDTYIPEKRKASQIHIAKDIAGYISKRLKEEDADE